MKARKIVLAIAVLTLAFGGVAYADTVTQKLRVLVNKKWEAGSEAVVADGKTYISSQVVSDKLHAIVLREDGRVSVFRPNVHMVTSSGSTIFADVKKGDVKFNTFIQVDSLKTDISELKLTIANPYGDETLLDQRKTGDADFPDGKNDFWITKADITYKFDKVGPYTIRFAVKPAGESSFQVISEKTINSKD
ncbi:hypothetical protein ACF3MZ_12490 [Paenibacillaceae bacterium WGS1546]|uniref:hypothetical protein n=1 Tax=Cohnella sp. WGS1546 TaxID=3366810 RepID=UPI00372D1597